MARVVVRPKAERDIRQIFVYLIENAGIEVTKRFRLATSETLRDLTRMPSLGAPGKVRRTAFQGVRMWRVKGFEDYLLFYFPLDQDGIAVERVIHAKRDYRRMMR
jgi:toxin ParE1/3/4